MKKIGLIIIIFILIIFPIMFLFSDGPDDDDVEVYQDFDYFDEDIILKIQIKDALFNTVIKTNVKIDVDFTFDDSSIKRIQFISDENGIILIDYEDKMNLSYIRLSIGNNERFYFDDIELEYPMDNSELYILYLEDSLVNAYVSSDEMFLWDNYTIIMKEYFVGKDINDKSAWTYLLNDENVIKETEETVAMNNVSISQYIDYLFLQQNEQTRNYLWSKYKKRIEDGVNNYINMIKSEGFKKNTNLNLIVYRIKSLDNLYQEYISVGVYTSKEFDILKQSNSVLYEWKRDSGKKIGYVLYDKKLYYNTHIRTLDSKIYD